jgi:arylsulfatase B
MPHNEPRYDENNPILRGDQPLVETQYLTDALTREAVAFIENNKTRPFFLFLSYNAVHSPMQAKGDALLKYKHIQDDHRRIFAAMLSSMDDSVGMVLETLRIEALESNSLIFFLSDNGGPTRELTSSNAPLRGGKGSLYEGGIRVPFLMQWKGQIPPGKEFHSPVLSSDVHATACRAAGIQSASDAALDGVDLLPFVQDKASGKPHASLYWRMGNRAAFRKGDWKIVAPSNSADETPKFELYNLAADLEESKDLSMENPETLEELIRDWKAMNSQMKPPFWHPGKSVAP